MPDKILLLPDGRSLAYREYGAPDGVPVVNNHGGLVCGLDIGPAHAAACELGIRLISPDRPGVGVSSPRPGRRTGDWPSDVAALLQHLGLQEAAAFGWSLGSEYALALGAAGIATRVVVVGGVPPMDSERLKHLNRSDRLFAWLSVNRPTVAKRTFQLMGRNTATIHRFTARTSGAADNPIIAGLDDFGRWMHHALLQPQGMVEEYQAMCRPWGFSPSDVQRPVTVWQGTDDEFVPVSLARELASALPDVDYREIAQAGHFLAYERWHEVLASVAQRPLRS